MELEIRHAPSLQQLGGVDAVRQAITPQPELGKTVEFMIGQNRGPRTKSGRLQSYAVSYKVLVFSIWWVDKAGQVVGFSGQAIDCTGAIRLNGQFVRGVFTPGGRGTMYFEAEEATENQAG